MIRLIGAILIVAGCGSIGFLMAASHKKESATLKNFLNALDIMECELKYRKSPLPSLCQYIAATQTGILKSFYANLAMELQLQTASDTAVCVQTAVRKTGQIPQQTKEMLLLLGQSLGRFDIEGQVLEIQSVRSEALHRLDHLYKNQEQQLKSYRTFGLCAGAAIAILFI